MPHSSRSVGFNGYVETLGFDRDSAVGNKRDHSCQVTDGETMASQVVLSPPHFMFNNHLSCAPDTADAHRQRGTVRSSDSHMHEIRLVFDPTTGKYAEYCLVGREVFVVHLHAHAVERLDRPIRKWNIFETSREYEWTFLNPEVLDIVTHKLN